MKFTVFFMRRNSDGVFEARESKQVPVFPPKSVGDTTCFDLPKTHYRVIEEKRK